MFRFISVRRCTPGAVQNPFIKKSLLVGYVDRETSLPFRDDSKDGEPTHTEEDQEAYNFLHRAPHRHSDLGGYGEDHGFHYPPRIFVDPDNPHVQPFYNKWIKTVNIREARYSHHRKFLHALDIDKLLRHGRVLPMPHRLLNDYIMTRVPLSDRDTSLMFRYANELLVKQADGKYYATVEEMFERCLATLIPPIEVGARTHAEMIRCCATCGRWTEGYDWFRQRLHDYKIQPTSEFYDAVIELCVSCEKVEEAWLQFDEMLQLGVKVHTKTLNRMLIISTLAKDYTKGKHVWSLFEYFQAQRTTESYQAYIDLACECGDPVEGLATFAETEHDAKCAVNIDMVLSLLYAFSVTPGYLETARGMFQDLLTSRRGLMPDHQSLLLVMISCAVNRNSTAAVECYHQATSSKPFISKSLAVFPETVYYLFRAMKYNDGTKVEYIRMATSVLQEVRAKHPRSELYPYIFAEYIAVLCSVGGYMNAWSALKMIDVISGDSHGTLTAMLNTRISFYLLDGILRGGDMDVEDLCDKVRMVLSWMIQRNVRVVTDSNVKGVFEKVMDNIGTSPSTNPQIESLREMWKQLENNNNRQNETTTPAAAAAGGWGEDPALPMPPRTSPQHRIRFNVTREEMKLAKYGQMFGPR
eukprot:PhF_6_TR601/c0_g1_i7/m.713